MHTNTTIIFNLSIARTATGVYTLSALIADSPFEISKNTMNTRCADGRCCI